MKQFTTILLTVLMAYGCSTPQRKVRLEPGPTITYNMPYPSFVGNSTRFALADGQEAIAFFNAETYKRMDVFTLDGKPVKTMPLKELTTIAHIEDIVALNRDSFLALGEYHNNVYLFNNEGKVLQQTHINDTIPGQGYNNWYTELSSNKCDGFIQDDSTLLLRSRYRERSYDDKRSKAEIRLLWHKINYSLPYFIAVHNTFSLQPKLQYALPGFYHRFLTDSFYGLETDNYVITPSYILLTSWYTDSLYVINKKSYHVEKAIKIQSAYTKIGSVVPNDSSEVLNDIIQTDGSISRVYYDKYRELYYVSVSHSIDRNATILERMNHRKWSLLIYDKTFKQLEEINMDPRYFYGSLLVTPKGIMLELYDYQKSNVPTQFQLFYVHQK